MPQNPNRDYEYLISKAIKQIIQNDTYLQNEFKNRLLSEKQGSPFFPIYDTSLVFNTISSYPSIAVYFDNAAKYNRQNILQMVKPIILIDVACESSHKDYGLNIAKENTFMYCKDVVHTVLCPTNLKQTVNGVNIQISDCELKSIEPTAYGNGDGGNWIYITTIALEINTPVLKAPRF